MSINSTFSSEHRAKLIAICAWILFVIFAICFVQYFGLLTAPKYGYPNESISIGRFQAFFASLATIAYVFPIVVAVILPRHRARRGLSVHKKEVLVLTLFGVPVSVATAIVFALFSGANQYDLLFLFIYMILFGFAQLLIIPTIIFFEGKIPVKEPNGATKYVPFFATLFLLVALTIEFVALAYNHETCGTALPYLPFRNSRSGCVAEYLYKTSNDADLCFLSYDPYDCFVRLALKKEDAIYCTKLEALDCDGGSCVDQCMRRMVVNYPNAKNLDHSLYPYSEAHSVSDALKFPQEVTVLSASYNDCEGDLRQLHTLENATEIHFFQCSSTYYGDLELPSKLQKLTIRGSVGKFPVGILSLSHLLQLELSGIWDIPSDIAKLSDLRVLKISGSMKDVPFGLFELKKLEVLDLSGTALEHMPDAIQALPNLKVLKLNKMLAMSCEEFSRIQEILPDVDFEYSRSMPGYPPSVRNCQVPLQNTETTSQVIDANVASVKNLSEEECRTDFAMAFVLLESEDHLHSKDDLDTLKLLQAETAQRFSWATRELATMDTTYPVTVLNVDESTDEYLATKKFISEYGDQFDFVTFYTTYETFPKQLPNGGEYTMYHNRAQSRIEGIGIDPHDGSSLYGSSGRLLGVNWMGQLHNDNETELAVNGILHETSHQWGAYLDFVDDTGQRSDALRNGAHWKKTLNTGYSFLQGLSWQDNGNGTFTALHNVDQRKSYADIDLYMMGLLPKADVDPLELIIPDEKDIYIELGATIPGEKKTITIDQIVDVMGERRCVTPGQAETREWQWETYTDAEHDFSVKYPKDLFTIQDAKEYVPSSIWEDPVTGTSLVHTIPVQYCGESGLPEHCSPVTVNMKMGFFVISRSHEEIKKKMKEEPIVDNTGFSYLSGIGGETTQYHLMPLNDQTTLMITKFLMDESVVRKYVEEDLFIPLREQKSYYEEILKTLNFHGA